MLGRVALTLPASASAVPVASAVAEGFAIEAGIARGDAARVAQAVRSAVGFSVDRSYGGRGGGDVELHLELDERGVTVDVHDWGIPMRRAGGEDGPLPAGLEEAEAVASDVRLINLADDGKRISLHVEAPHATPVVPVVDGAADDERGDRARALEDVGIRDGTVADADAIAELLYRGYALKYRHRDFYTPRWVEAAIAEGRVLSTVAYAEERLIGHHALLLEEPGEAAESGVAVIDRAWRGLGLFDPMFAHTVARARGVGIPAVFGRATCAHVYSQRSEFKHGYREAALLLGGSPAAMAQQQTEAGEGPARRGANLVSYLPVTGERARGIIPPAPYVDEVRRLISHIGLEPESAEQSPVPVPDQAVADPEDGTAIPMPWTAPFGRTWRGQRMSSSPTWTSASSPTLRWRRSTSGASSSPGSPMRGWVAGIGFVCSAHRPTSRPSGCSSRGRRDAGCSSGSWPIATGSPEGG